MDKDELEKYEAMLRAMEREIRSSQIANGVKDSPDPDLDSERVEDAVKRPAEELLRLRSFVAGKTSSDISAISQTRGNGRNDSRRIETLEQRVRDRDLELRRLRLLLYTLSLDSPDTEEAPSVEKHDEQILQLSEIVSDEIDLTDDSALASFSVTERLTFMEAYTLLIPQQKQFCDGLVAYAVKKSGLLAKYAKYHLSVGSGAKRLLKLSIKDGIVIACFHIEDQRVRELRRKSGETDIRIKETTLPVSNDDAYATAKAIIDLRETQIAEDIAIRKEKRKEARRKKQ